MTFTYDDHALYVQLSLPEKIAAMHGDISVPFEDIVAIKWHEKFYDFGTWRIRFPGTYFPRLLIAGSFWSSDGWDFVYSHNPTGFINPTLSRVVVIVTKERRYRRIILRTTNSEAERVINAWKAWQKENDSV